MREPNLVARAKAEIEAALWAQQDAVRAEGARRYLKSELQFIGIPTAPFRRVVRGALRLARLRREELLALVEALWSQPVFELKAAAVEALVFRWRALESRDLWTCERMLRESGTWALVDALSTQVVGRLVERDGSLGTVLDRWAADPDFWVRRAAMLALLVPLRQGKGDWERFARYADAMLDEREFFIRKAIGWVLREVAKRRPVIVADWLGERLGRVSGVTMREASRPLPEPRRTQLLAAWRVAGRGRSSHRAAEAKAPAVDRPGESSVHGQAPPREASVSGPARGRRPAG